jgi:2-dehydropantoate 2-reductase
MKRLQKRINNTDLLVEHPIDFKMSEHFHELSSNPLRFLIFGTGAIGTYIGGSLALRGQHVIFLDRPETKASITVNGMRLNINGEIFEIREPALVDSLQEALEFGPFDVAIFALKSFDTLQAVQEIQAHLKQMPPILCLQNGVENEPAIAKTIGENKVIPASLTSAIAKRAAGEIILERLRGVGITAGYPLSEKLEAAFNFAGLNARLYHSASAMKWSKMITNLLANASSAILAMTPIDIFSDRELYKLEISQLREALMIMQAMGIKVIDLPGTPVRMLAFAVQWLPHRLSRPLLKRAVGEGRGRKMPSFYLDLHSGRGKTEADYLNGAVVRYGERLGISTPVNRLLNETLSEMSVGKIPLESFALQPEKLLALWGQRKSVKGSHVI